MPKTVIWALLVGIDEYPVEPIIGSVQDLKNVYQYLSVDLGVPEDHIVALQNQEATRAGIINAFFTHLIDNDRIAKGDAILFHFSGHGSRGPAPASWPLNWMNMDEDSRDLEFIVPYDGVRRADLLFGYDHSTSPAVSGIPDRTLGALFRKVAKRHGNNITVVLDCCHSGHCTRSSSSTGVDYVARGISPALVGKLDDNTDKEIWSDEPAPAPEGPLAMTRSAPYLRGAFVDRQDDSHVLMAACGRREDANGSAWGGLFTNAWLEALRDEEIRPRSYSEILRHVQNNFAQKYRQFDAVPPEQRPDRQNPQCEGINRDRIVFRTNTVDPGRFVVKAGRRPDECIIEAGEMAGIRLGTVFELRQLSSSGIEDIVLCSAVATDVRAGRTAVRIPCDMSVPLDGVRAFIVRLGEPLVYAVANMQPDNPAASKVHGLLLDALGEATGSDVATYERAERTIDADLVLRVDADNVFFDRRDPILSYIDTSAPRIDARDVEIVFPEIMPYIARFNFYLAHNNPAHPLTEGVDFSLVYLESPNAISDEEEYMIPGDEVPWVNDEAVLLHDEEALYGIVLRNRTNIPLFPYVFFFDSGTYSIERFYGPLNPTVPPLKPGGELQLGRSIECMAAMSFTADAEGRRDTGFLKVILTTEDVGFRFMEQSAVLGVDERGYPNYLGTRGESDEPENELELHRAIWDVIQKKVTVLPHV